MLNSLFLRKVAGRGVASQVQVNITLVKKCFYYFKNCIVTADDSNSGPTV
jgi:hypothetical protein